jgi:hypothetical protein
MLVDNMTAPLDSASERTVAYVTIEIVNLWSSFCRAYYLSCCLGTMTAGGHRVVVNAGRFHSTMEAIGFAVEIAGRGRNKTGPWRRMEEPAWHVPATFLRVQQALQPSNLVNMHNAFSYSTTAFDDLRTLRNFFAHRNEDTARGVLGVARNNGISPRLHPADVICSRASNRPQSLVSDWLDDVRVVAQDMCR